MTDLKPCPDPWCESESLPSVQRGQITREAPVQRQAGCDCGIVGPACDTEAEAIAAWNDRPADPHCDALAAEMERLRDCDWVISLPDRMDAVRDIARAALAAYWSAKP